jgi:hypothetical protein
MLDAVKVPGGPSGEEWYVAPVSVPKAIGDLKQIDAQRAPRHSQPCDHVGIDKSRRDDEDMASQARRSQSEKKQAKGSETEPAIYLMSSS